jgi:hypothetical protein
MVVSIRSFPGNVLIRAASIATLAVLAAAASYGGVITTPVGLTPGTQYQLAFVTTDAFPANLSTIATYNGDVASEAALNAVLAAFDTANGVTWSVIGSTTTVNAVGNAPSSGLVYTLNGVEVASGTNGLYSGSLLSPVDIDQNGNTLSTGVWTGSNSAGTASGGINDLGQTFPEIGVSTSTTGGWLAAGNGVESGNSNPLYALSSVITVPAASGTPEPGTFALVAGATLLLLGITRFRKRIGS